MNNVSFQVGISNCKYFFPSRLLIPFFNFIMGQLLAFVLDVQQLWPLLSLFPLSAHSGIFSQLYRVYSARSSAGVNQHNSVNISGAVPTHTSFKWASERLVHLEAGSQWSKITGRTCLRCPVICVCTLWKCSLNFSLEPWIKNCSQHMFFLVKHCMNPGVCGQCGCCYASVLVHAAHTSFWNYTTVCASTQSSLEGINNLKNILVYWYFSSRLVRQSILKVTNIFKYWMGYGLMSVEVQMQHYLEPWQEAALAAYHDTTLSYLRRQGSSLRSGTSERAKHLCTSITFFLYVCTSNIWYFWPSTLNTHFVAFFSII